jgi:hypothetical protein
MLLSVFGPTAASAQELTTTVFPSEDELQEALRLGEITDEQFLILQEIIIHGLDSTNEHLLDEIPNLSYFLRDLKSLTTPLNEEQRASFSAPAEPSRRWGRFKYRYYEELEQAGRSQYRASFRSQVAGRIEAAFKVHREYAGRERVVSRRITYRDRRAAVREVTVGNFTQQFGLGTVFGYRGKLLDYSHELGDESFLVPDYGGFNGVYARAAAGMWESRLLGSAVRDKDHGLVSAGVMVGLTKSAFRPSATIGVSRLKNRRTGVGLDDIKYALSALYRYQRSYASLEHCGQAGERPSWGALVLEGRHHFGGAEVKYAGWVYADDYIDLTGGSKAGNLRHSETLEAVGFEYSARRPGQEGGLVKSLAVLYDGVQIVSSLLYAGRNADTADVQFLTGLVKRLSADWEMRCDYTNKAKKRVYVGRDYTVDQRSRVELRFRTGDLSGRSYIAYNTRTGGGDFAAVFINLRYHSESLGVLEIWSNLGHLNLHGGTLDYWYGFVRSEQRLFKDVAIGMKLSHSFRREGGGHRTVVLLELGAAL